MHRLALVLISVLSSASSAFAASDMVDGILTYRGFTVNVAVLEKANVHDAIETSLKKQIDIVADCGAKPEVMAFFRGQKINLKFGAGNGGGRFSAAGIELDAAPQPPEKPVVLHELLHALHARYMPNGVNNVDIVRFYEIAVRIHAYPANEYVMKNKAEFFAVTASLYLWGHVPRPPNNRETLRGRQPRYYAWLGELFGVKK